MLTVIRVRGNMHLNPGLKKTLELLCLTRANHLVLVPESRMRMAKKVEAYVTYGEITEQVLEKLLKKRGRLVGNKKISEEFLKKNKLSWEKLTKGILEEKISLKKIGIKPVFRMKPPKKGFGRKGIKKPYAMGGGHGYRATDINNIVNRML